ncbi:MAG: PrsW family glutamic-type intramembrane protease [Lachnospiraceae bacterium]|nr:PrsW family glutamic-type intramembrane protease [Lachnospiraceae bacterium]
MLIQLALAPVLLFLFFMFIKDKYEKEPLILLFVGAIYGAYLAAPVLAIDVLLMGLKIGEKYPVIFSAFVTSAANEEGMKLLFLMFLMHKNKEFNEPVDGIVYSVFIALGFAGAENIIYVLSPTLGGVGTALQRAIFSVPGHGLFAIAMGYYFAYWHYYKKGMKYLFLAFFVSWFLHGLYNFILLIDASWYLFIFIPYQLLLWMGGILKINTMLKASPFKFLKNH